MENDELSGGFLRHSQFLTELSIFILLLLLPLLLLAPVALGSKTLLPVDVLFTFEPYRSAALQFEISHPQNHLVADLLLENYAWKRFLRQAIQERELPLWDPYIFAGHPFLANGQHSALYPLSFLFYVMPLWRAFGVFTWLQLGLAGIFAYIFARVLGIRRLGSLVVGVVLQFRGFMVTSIVHPMIIAGASWLPFILTMVELIVRQQPALGGRPATLPWALLGAIGLGCQMLAGHAENSYFVLLVTALYAVWRLVQQRSEGAGERDSETREGAWWRRLRRPVLWLAVMVTLGLALGAVQFIPLYEVVSTSFRGGEAAATLAQVRGWAYPWRRLITFAVPNFFGNPAHHDHFDLFRWQRVPVTVNAHGQPILSHEWGIKNYVEGGAYLGLLPLFFAAIAILHQFTNPRSTNSQSTNLPVNRYIGRLVSWWRHPHIPFFTLLSLFSLGCIFGTPLYAIVYALPLLKQSHSPFRWVFPLTLSVAVLSGFGVDVLQRSGRAREQGSKGASRITSHASRTTSYASRITHHALRLTSKVFFLNSAPSLITFLAGIAFWGGIATLTGLALSRAFFAQIEPLIERVFWSLAKAPTAFADHRAFYSYEAKWVALFSLLLTGTGIVLRVSRCPIYLPFGGAQDKPVWEYLAIILLVVDFVLFGVGFHPAVDPALLDYTPPVVEFLKNDESLWRYAAFTPPGTTKTMNANVGMFYDLQSVDGYDSLFSDQYRDYMALIEPQGETQYNRIASFHQSSSLDSPLTDLLNVKYVITEVEIDKPQHQLVYEDEGVRVYENLGAMPRAFTLPASATVKTDNFNMAVQAYDPRYYVILESDELEEQDVSQSAQPAPYTTQSVTSYRNNEVFVDVTVSEPSWLVLADAYFPGWKVFVRPQGAGEDAEEQITLHRVNGTFRGVLLEESGAWTLRFKYSPDSVKIGAFISFIAGMTLLFLIGIYFWRFFYREEVDGSRASAVRRVAKNSLAPIVLSLFNRAIDMAFAALMARILGPVGTGRYATAISVFLWFDIITNFGLDMYLMREVARDRERTRAAFVNTTALRLLLLAGATPVLIGFLVGWQALVIAPLARETVWAVGLLYVGLLPGTLSNGLTALFRAYEKHEVPAAIQTVTTIVKVTLGVLALVSGLGIVGLAGASILTNAVTMTVLAILARRSIWGTLSPAPNRLRWTSQRAMLIESWPLMLSLLLQALFPGLNVLLLQNLQGDAVVGWYDAARKWLDAFNIIPSFFTFAVFPVMSRQAAEDRAGLRRSCRLSVKLLIITALPVALMVTLLAGPLVGLLSGASYLPHGAIVLRLLIWSILFGWLNSLTNYVLIALERQRYVLIASGSRVLFTVAANLIFVGRFSYVGSAWIIIAGELLLALLFHFELERHVQIGAGAWVRAVGRPALAGLAMGATALLLAPISRPLALIACIVIYGAALILLRALNAEEWALLAPLLPDSLRRAVGRVIPSKRPNC